MNTQQGHDPGRHWRQNFRAALAKIKGNRLYALTADSELAGGAICAAFHEKNAGSIDDFLRRLVVAVPALVQQRGTTEEELPEIPKDVFGRPLPNPWIGGSLSERNAVFKFSEALAKHFERLAKGGGWQMHLEGLEREASRALVNAVPYGPEQHAENVFRAGNATERTLFINANTPEKVALYEREAKPIKLPWSHATLDRTELTRITKADAELGALMIDAEQIQTGWAQEQEQIALAEVEAAKQKLQDAEAALGKGAASTDSRIELVRQSSGRGGAIVSPRTKPVTPTYWKGGGAA